MSRLSSIRKQQTPIRPGDSVRDIEPDRLVVKYKKRLTDKRYDRSNGVVLCIKCHNKFHRKYKYKAVKDPKYLTEYLEG